MLSLSKHEDQRRRTAMSRAFVKETAESAPPPERMVDEGPNLVTPQGLAQIDGHIARIEAAMKTETNALLLSRRIRLLQRSIRSSRTPAVRGLQLRRRQ